MANVSRPLVALLVATLAFLALWTVALKPSGSSGGGGTQGPSGLASAVAQAHRAAAASAAASAAQSGVGAPHSGSTASHAAAGSATTATGLPATTSPTAANRRGTMPSQTALSGSPATSSTGPAATGGPAASAGPSATGTGPAALKAALAAHEVVVMLFYNPAGADDQAVKQEIASLHPSSGTLVLSAPIAQLASYSSIMRRVPVSQAPTLLFIDRHGNASEIVGFADDLEIAQRLAATLAVN